MSEQRRAEPNPFEGLIRPWFLPSFGLTIAVGVGVFWMTGMLTESAVGAIVAVLVPLVLGLMVLRPALTASFDPVTRALLGVAAVLSFAVAAIPAYEAVHPGEPHLVAELTRAGDDPVRSARHERKGPAPRLHPARRGGRAGGGVPAGRIRRAGLGGTPPHHRVRPRRAWREHQGDPRPRLRLVRGEAPGLGEGDPAGAGAGALHCAAEGRALPGLAPPRPGLDPLPRRAGARRRGRGPLPPRLRGHDRRRRRARFRDGGELQRHARQGGRPGALGHRPRRHPRRSGGRAAPPGGPADPPSAATRG